MATYTQWFNARAKGIRHRVLWVCGDQPVLVSEVIATVIADSGASAVGLTRLDLTPGADRRATAGEVWDAAGQHPMEDAPQVTVVYGADLIQDWTPLQRWVTALGSPYNKNVLLVFVSEADNFPFKASDSPKLRPLQPHVEWINRSRYGLAVRCAMPNAERTYDPKTKTKKPAHLDAVLWLCRIRAMSEEVALYLLSRTGESLYEAGNVARKLACFPGEVTTAVIDAVCYSTARSYADSLIHFRKEQAMAAAARVDRAEVPRILADLDNTLEDLARLHTLARARKLGGRDLALEFGSRLPYVRALIPAAPKYDLTRRAGCRDALALVDTAYRHGADAGLLEVLTASW